jgi:hypothetical protein
LAQGRTINLAINVFAAAALLRAVDSTVNVFAIIATINLAVNVFASLTGSGAVNGSIDVTTSRPRLWGLFSAEVTLAIYDLIEAISFCRLAS